MKTMQTVVMIVTVVFGMVTTAPATVLYYYQLDSNLNDSVGGANGTGNGGGPTFVADVPGIQIYDPIGNTIHSDTGSAQFDGVNDMITGLDVTYLDDPNNPFTLEGFFKTSSAAGSPFIFEKFGTAGNYRVDVQIQSDGTLRFVLVNQNINQRYINSTTVVTDGEWHHFAVSRGAGTSFPDMRLWVDGVSQGSIIGNLANPGISTLDASLGAYAGGANFLNGNLDEIRIQNVFVTDTSSFLQVVAPEPSAVALLALGGLLLWRRRSNAV